MSKYGNYPYFVVAHIHIGSDEQGNKKHEFHFRFHAYEESELREMQRAFNVMIEKAVVDRPKVDASAKLMYMEPLKFEEEETQ